MANNLTVLSVTELTRTIKGVLEARFSNLAVQGEISNCKLHSSGHLYFTLKDEHAQLQAVMWRSRVGNLFFTPQDGMNVIARGNITVYEVRGVYQIDVVQLRPLGIGELQLAFERLKQRLAGEGLFDVERKKPLPPYPRRIGIVTSSTGAAIKDIVNIISRRFPAVELILCPVKVQGVGAAEEIATAIRDFNRYGKIDVMIVGRGGGSLEDLWAFNEEVVARAIYGSKIPVISAVGHEIDFTIADFVADLRAPTPSAAAELVVVDRSEIVEIVRNFWYNAHQIASNKISLEKERIKALLRSHTFNRPLDLVRQYSQRLDEVKHTLSQSVAHHLRLLQEHVGSLQKRVASVNPELTLERGYAMVTRNGKVVSRAKVLSQSDHVRRS
ncbi:MAG: exodeoxyribonuclease VII large subunit [Ignavibacteriales bacterium]|nr:exodeoxyribonuclease VII large subunit [Ignavibacteriales bacterium]